MVAYTLVIGKQRRLCLDWESDFAYIMGLVRQAYKFQMGGD